MAGIERAIIKNRMPGKNDLFLTQPSCDFEQIELSIFLKPDYVVPATAGVSG